MLEYEVFIPARDAARTLRLPVLSLQAQELPPQRITVVNDGSIDDTLDVCRALGVDVIDGGGVGLARAQNRALQSAAYEMVSFLDADDAWTVDAGRVLAGALEERGGHLAAVSGAAAMFDADDDFDRVLAACGHPAHEEAAFQLLRESDLWQRNLATKSATMFRTQPLTEVGGYRPLPSAEDYDLLLRLQASGFQVAVTTAIICHRMLSASTMTANSQRMLLGEVQALKGYVELLSAKGQPRPGPWAVRNRLLRAWLRALARDADYHGHLRDSPDLPVGGVAGSIAGRLVRDHVSPAAVAGRRLMRARWGQRT